MEFKSGYLTMGMRKIDPAFSWQEILRDRLLFNYSAIASSPRTEDSEQRLSIHPAHVYWYLLAVEAAYRECLVISEITTEVGAPTLTPFDTGGLAQGYFSANVAADPAAKTVADHSFNFSDGLQRFSQWLPLAFDTSNEYWQHPRKPPKLLAAGVRVGDPPSWTWEARHPQARVKADQAVKHKLLIIRPELFDQFLKWLPVNPGNNTDSDIVGLLDWLLENTRLEIDALPGAGAMFAEALAS